VGSERTHGLAHGWLQGGQTRGQTRGGRRGEWTRRQNDLRNGEEGDKGYERVQRGMNEDENEKKEREGLIQW
jgi:hypothetical protein